MIALCDGVRSYIPLRVSQPTLRSPTGKNSGLSGVLYLANESLGSLMFGICTTLSMCTPSAAQPRSYSSLYTRTRTRMCVIYLARSYPRQSLVLHLHAQAASSHHAHDQHAQSPVQQISAANPCAT